MKNIPEGQVIVYEDCFQIVTWNQGASFNVYFQVESDRWVNMECFSVYNVKTLEQAKNVVQEHVDLNNEILGD